MLFSIAAHVYNRYGVKARERRRRSVSVFRKRGSNVFKQTRRRSSTCLSPEFDTYPGSDTALVISTTILSSHDFVASCLFVCLIPWPLVYGYQSLGSGHGRIEERHDDGRKLGRRVDVVMSHGGQNGQPGHRPSSPL